MQQPIWMTAADLRFAFRVLAKNRGFTLTVVCTLALGIGAATTIFSVVNTVLLQPLGYREPDRLVLIRERIRKITPDLLAVPAPDILEFRKETAAFEDVAGWIGRPSDISGDSSRPARVDVTRVTANIFPMLGRTAALGRTFTAAEDAQRQPVAVLSDVLWRTRYAADPNILGRKILLDRAPYTVIGVMAPEFTFPPRGLGGSDGVWIPMAFTAEELTSYGDMFNYSALARLRPGVTLETAAAVLSSTSARILAQYPAEVRSQLALESVPLPLSEQVVRGSRTLVLLLGSAVLLLLLIACANVASLLLSRAAAREREFAIRAAIGAGRSRIASQWLAESLWLSLAAALLGLFAAWYGTDGLARLNLASIPRLAEVHMDARVLIVSLALSTVTALIFGTVPAWFTARADLTAGLKDGGRGSSGPGRHRVRSVLVTAEVALALMLLAGAGLLFRSFLIARAADPGIRAENVLSFRLSLPASAYPKPADNERFSLDLDRRLHALPGVLAAG
ncbi:MAG: ABC transporter permease [Acidobacteria bacterium]|nr:ABC transporter permease [Acidobacteriota bacterium]